MFLSIDVWLTIILESQLWIRDNRQVIKPGYIIQFVAINVVTRLRNIGPRKQ